MNDYFSSVKNNDILFYIDIDSGLKSLILQKPINLELKDVNTLVTSVINLDWDKREMYKLFRDKYKINLLKYKKNHAALSDL